MSQPYPFDVAYDYFAHRIVTVGLPPVDGSLPPWIALVCVENGKVTRCEPLPIDLGMLAGGGDGLHHMVNETMAHFASFGDDPTTATYCLVVGMEALTVLRRKAEGDADPSVESLVSHPDRQSAICIMVHRPECVRMGLLPIDDQRRVTYAALLPEGGTFERVGHINQNLH